MPVVVGVVVTVDDAVEVGVDVVAVVVGVVLHGTHTRLLCCVHGVTSLSLAPHTVQSLHWRSMNALGVTDEEAPQGVVANFPAGHCEHAVHTRSADAVMAALSYSSGLRIGHGGDSTHVASVEAVHAFSSNRLMKPPQLVHCVHTRLVRPNGLQGVDSNSPSEHGARHAAQTRFDDVVTSVSVY